MSLCSQYCHWSLNINYVLTMFYSQDKNIFDVLAESVINASSERKRLQMEQCIEECHQPNITPATWQFQWWKFEDSTSLLLLKQFSKHCMMNKAMQSHNSIVLRSAVIKFTEISVSYNSCCCCCCCWWWW